eukprot:scaffold52984_cov73-Phaeocystis_antarctica.AAC.3
MCTPVSQHVMPACGMTPGPPPYHKDCAQGARTVSLRHVRVEGLRLCLEMNALNCNCLLVNQQLNSTQNSTVRFAFLLRPVRFERPGPFFSACGHLLLLQRAYLLLLRPRHTLAYPLCPLASRLRSPGSGHFAPVLTHPQAVRYYPLDLARQARVGSMIDYPLPIGLQAWQADDHIRAVSHAGSRTRVPG